jgi:hypothetical protein
MTVHLILNQKSGRQFLKKIQLLETLLLQTHTLEDTQKGTHRDKKMNKKWSMKMMMMMMSGRVRDEDFNNKWELIFMYLFGDEQRYRGTIFIFIFAKRKCSTKNHYYYCSYKSLALIFKLKY